MKYLLILLSVVLFSCQEEEYNRLYSFEYKYKMYELKESDTLKIVAPVTSRFYLEPYKDSYNMMCDGMERPVLYRITYFKLLN